MFISFFEFYLDKNINYSITKCFILFSHFFIPFNANWTLLSFTKIVCACLGDPSQNFILKMKTKTTTGSWEIWTLEATGPRILMFLGYFIYFLWFLLHVICILFLCRPALSTWPLTVPKLYILPVLATRER